MEGGPPCFPQTHRGSWYSGSSSVVHSVLYGTLTPSGGAFQRLRVGSRPLLLVLQPHHLRKDDGLGSSRLARHYYGNLRLISLRRATEMFQFAHCPPTCLLHSAGGVQTSLWTGCPIRTLRAHRSHAAPPERFAGLRVLHRPSAPRHPPRTLSRLCSASHFAPCFLRTPVLLTRLHLRSSACSRSVLVLPRQN